MNTRKFILATLIATFGGMSLMAQTITLPDTPMLIKSGHLKVGGTNGKGGSIAANSYYLLRNGHPILPVCGEMQYSRYNRAEWRQELLKMKAGGVNVVTTYVLWALHEEHEGQFVWTGNRDLRAFIKLCDDLGLDIIVRMGPFCHAEFRNGGFPDWIFARPLEVRSNNPLYLKYTRRLYNQIAQQMKGLYYKDGGPIIGVQVENECQHSAGCWAHFYEGGPIDYTAASYDADYTMLGVSEQDKQIPTAELGNQHMMTLKKIAEEEGVDVPLFTATGWGKAAVLANEGLPVTACYPFPYWDKPKMTKLSLYTDIHSRPDYSPVRYQATDFPSISAEMGMGMLPTYKIRPRMYGYDAEAIAQRCLASGCNAIGYYMYHGGTTPHQEGGVGFFNDEPYGVPKMSYEWDAPLMESGLENFSYRHIRLINRFALDFGELLAPMEVVLPEGSTKIALDDHETLRYCVRAHEGSGFLFVNNYQDHDTLRKDWTNRSVTIDGKCLKEPVVFHFNLQKNEEAIMPFNLPLGESGSIIMEHAIAQPLARIGSHYFFFAIDGNAPVYIINGRRYSPKAGLKSTFSVKNGGEKVLITTLTRQQALDAVRVGNQLVITAATVLPDNDHVQLLSLDNPNFQWTTIDAEGKVKNSTKSVSTVKIDYAWEKVAGQKYALTLKSDLPVGTRNESLADVIARVDYTADYALMFIDGRMEGDQLYDGRPWYVALRRFADRLTADNPMVFHFRPLDKSAPFLYMLPADAVPDFSKGSVLNIKKVELLPQYRLNIF